MPTWVEAGLWGPLGGGALVVGALIAWSARVPPEVVASVMAFGSGVLISAVAFDLVEEAARAGGLVATASGFLVGAVVYLASNLALARRGARHRKRSGPCWTAFPSPSSWVSACWVAGSVSLSVLAAVVISNVPEGLSSAAGMKRSGRSARYVFGVWGGIALASGLAALLGYGLLGGAPPEVEAVITAVAAGAILTMIADTMIPEAFEDTHAWTGLITAVGFLTAFPISLASWDAGRTSTCPPRRRTTSRGSPSVRAPPRGQDHTAGAEESAAVTVGPPPDWATRDGVGPLT